jgi:hypothetical protein
LPSPKELDIWGGASPGHVHGSTIPIKVANKKPKAKTAWLQPDNFRQLLRDFIVFRRYCVFKGNLLLQLLYHKKPLLSTSFA